MKQVFAQIHIDLVTLQRTEEWVLIYEDLKTLDYTMGMIREDVGLLNEKNNCHRKEIDDVSSEWKMLFEIVGQLETILDTQKHNIMRLKRSIATLDQNTCRCCNHLLSPELHGLMGEEGLEYSSDSEYQEAPMEPVNYPWLTYSPPPPVIPPSNLDKFRCPNSPVPEGQATGFSYDIALDVVTDSEEVPPLLENIDPITGCIEGFFETENGKENSIKSTKFISKFYVLKSVKKVKLFWE